MSPQTLALFASPAFAWSLLAGTLALAWALTEQRLAARREATPWLDPGATLTLAFFLLLALLRETRVPGAWGAALSIGLGLALGRRARMPILATPLAAVPGAVVLALAGGLPEGLVFDALALAAAPLAALVAAGVGILGPRRAPACLLLAIVGLFYTVPDTEEALLLLGAALPWGALLLLRDPPCPGPLGAGTLTGALCWVAATGGRGRPGSAIAALACLGLVVLAVPLTLQARRWGRSWPNPGLVGLLLTQLALVFVASRLVPHHGVLVALLGELAWLAVVAVVVIATAAKAGSRSD